MKKILFFVSSLFAFAFLFSLNISPDTINNRMNLTLNEDVKAEYGWKMETVNCKHGGTYNRCEQVFYSSYCDVHAQTLCPEPE